MPLLAELKTHTNYFAFMQNSWDIKAEIQGYLPDDTFMIAFPSSVGGGRDQDGLRIIIFDEATRLGGTCAYGIDDLQQSITAGALSENKDFLTFANNYHAIKKMVKAFREGLEVCRLQGVTTSRIFPANMFRLPTFLVAHIMQKMFLEPDTIDMVCNHMKKGLPEWIAGYKEVLHDGLEQGLPMTVWKSYDKSIENHQIKK